MRSSCLLSTILQDLRRGGFDLNQLTDLETRRIFEHFNSATVRNVLVLAQIVKVNAPITVRGAFYRAVSCGLYPDTADEHYRQCGRILLALRRAEIIDYRMIVDSTRRRLKPSSWTGLTEYAETVARCYRKDFWARQQDYVEIFVEKDAMAAVIEPVTQEYDIYLNVIRGCVSESFVWNVAEIWKQIEKPITAYYLGDHDPAGLQIERDIRERLEGFTEANIIWVRLAIAPGDFADPANIGFPIKGNRSIKAWQSKHRDYLREHGDRCVEVDAIAPDAIRNRIRVAIENHIDQGEWLRLQQIEKAEQQTIKMVLAPSLGSAA